MEASEERTPQDWIETARTYGEWLLVEWPCDWEVSAPRSAYRDLDLILPNQHQFVCWGEGVPEASICDYGTVHTALRHATDIEIVEEPPFEPECPI